MFKYIYYKYGRIWKIYFNVTNYLFFPLSVVFGEGKILPATKLSLYTGWESTPCIIRRYQRNLALPLKCTEDLYSKSWFIWCLIYSRRWGAWLEAREEIFFWVVEDLCLGFPSETLEWINTRFVFKYMQNFLVFFVFNWH